MSKNQVYIAINLEDYTLKPLKHIFANFYKLQENVNQTNEVIKQFAQQSTTNVRKLDKSIYELEQELEKLKEQRLFEKDIDRIKQLNKEIDKLEKKIKELKGETKQDFFSNSLLGHATHIKAIGESVESISEALDFSGELGEIHNMLSLIGENSPRTAREVYRLSQVYGDSFEEIIQAANAMTKHLGGTFEENLRLIEEGYRKGANLNQNMLDQLREYPSALKGLNITADQLLAVMAEANKAGVWDDRMIDTIKEAYNQLSQLTPEKVNLFKQS